ncbi:CLUMA_CG010811, isoform A [Clunio marinus]|uniref:CLUMA_CG010811, isoform A n=1 Tax=Clunio marinus TaxID=568069 RepID=A0A1J1IEJ4_9DIPT|nr:CLUMA_CG010811, isoform A [Clunio marinus]
MKSFVQDINDTLDFIMRYSNSFPNLRSALPQERKNKRQVFVKSLIHVSYRKIKMRKYPMR